MKNYLVMVLFTFLTPTETRLFAQSAVTGFTIENYYKVKWGHSDEFITLWKKNHYPLLKKLLEKGDVLSILAEAPLIYGSEDSQWDFKVTLTFKNEQLAFDYSITELYRKLLYPDLEAYKKAEQYRYELLIAHWDIPVENLVLN
ncbi:MAG: hypothetical protein V4456_19565 [Bacteroidota bacterium]